MLMKKSSGMTLIEMIIA
ncbi:prepilin-type N-terminal cleavage/methylation domain-containing protein, partial [Vibrio parahaemolyticus]|nr:prepilin-type N-terminal cleavage/methylation domain-containing protein [Vibrio parahaemolyticus]